MIRERQPDDPVHPDDSVPPDHLEHLKVLIAGMGKTGLSCTRFLHARGVPVEVIDSRPQPPELERLRVEMPGVKLYLGGFDAAVFARAELIVVSPGISLREPVLVEARRRGIPIIGDIELFARYVDRPNDSGHPDDPGHPNHMVVAITGSNGKSTVTTLLGEMARQAGLDVYVGGNLGTPALDLLPLSVNGSPAECSGLSGTKGSRVPAPDSRLYILELSSFQLETTSSLNPRVAVVLNISADHMDRYRDLNAYAAVKRRVYQGDGVMVINRDDVLVAGMLDDLEQPDDPDAGRCVVGFTLGEPREGDFGLCSQDGDLWLVKGTGDMPRINRVTRLLRADELRIPGRHNLANALAAMALGEVVGIPMPVMLRCLREFTGLEHRMQWIGETDGVQWYNDSKATNVGAALAAITGLSGKVVLIAGGDGKGADFGPLRAALAGKARAVVLIGRDASLIERALGGDVDTIQVRDMKQAVAEARSRARPGDSVLLSPACASLDQYRDYQQRGAAFVEAVRGWMQ